jgi:hypothetical protein
MIEWFNSAFGEPSEQAKLFTVVLSTIFAVVIVLLNQWFISRRARNELLINKAEEYYAMVSLVDGNLHNEMYHRFFKEDLEFDTQCINKSTLLQTLYFPELNDAQLALVNAHWQFRSYIDDGLHSMVLSAKESQATSLSSPSADYINKSNDLMFHVNDCITNINALLIQTSSKYK